MTTQILKRGNSPFLPTDHTFAANFIPMEDCLQERCDIALTYIVHDLSQWPRGLRRVSAAGICGLESLCEYGCLYVVNGAFCQLEVSATGRSLFQGVLPSVVCLSVTEKPQKKFVGPLGLLSHDRRKCFI